MEERLIVRLQEGSEQIEWVLQTAQGMTTAAKVGSFADINLPDFKGKLTILVPSAAVYLTKAKLPKLSEAKLRKAVPFVIEDELATGVEDSHFAYNRNRTDEKAVVGVVRREQMDAWLDKIPAGLKSQLFAVIPDVFALPHEKNKWSVANFNDSSLVRTNEVMGFSVEKNLLPTVMSQYLQEEGREKPEEILLIQPASVTDLTAELSSKIDVPIKVVSTDESAVSYFAKNLSRVAPLNLLQGDYKTAYQVHGVERLQQLAILMAVIWFGLLTLFTLTKYAIVNHQTTQLENQVAAAYKEIFPTASSVNSPKQRIEQAMTAVKKAKQQGLFLRLLADVSPVFVGKPGVQVQGFIYNNQQVDVQVSVSDFQMLDKITSEIKAKGFQVEQSHAAKAGDVIQSHLIIKAG